MIKVTLEMHSPEILADWPEEIRYLLLETKVFFLGIKIYSRNRYMLPSRGCIEIKP